MSNNFMVVDIVERDILPTGIREDCELNRSVTTGLLSFPELLRQVKEAIDLHPEICLNENSGIAGWRCLKAMMSGYLRLKKEPYVPFTLASVVLCRTGASSKLAVVRWFTDSSSQFQPLDNATQELVRYLDITLYRTLQSFWQETEHMGYFLINASALRCNLGRFRDVHFHPHYGISSGYDQTGSEFSAVAGA